MQTVLLPRSTRNAREIYAWIRTVRSYRDNENRARTVAAKALARTLERPPWLRAHGSRAPLAEVSAAMHGPPPG